MKNIKKHTLHLFLLIFSYSLLTTAKNQQYIADQATISQAHFFTTYPNLSLLKKMLNHGINLNKIYNEYGQSPLTYAAKKNMHYFILWLVEHGANPYQKDQNKKTIQDYITNQGYVWTKNNRKIVLQQNRYSNTTPLYVNSKTNQDYFIKKIRSLPMYPENFWHEYGRFIMKPYIEPERNDFLLNNYIKKHVDPVLVSLLQEGFNINSIYEDGQTALEIAINMNHTFAASFLLLHGAQPTVGTITLAIEKNAHELFPLLLAHASYRTLDQTIKDHHLLQASKSVCSCTPQAGSWGEDINECDEKSAVFNTQTTKIMQWLIEYGANPHALDAYGKNAMYYAIKNKNWSAFTLLLEHNVAIQV